MRVADAYFSVGEHLAVNWFIEQVNALPTTNHWEAMARESFRDDLDWQLRSLTVGILRSHGNDMELEEAIAHWKTEQEVLGTRWQNMLADLRSRDELSYPMIAVALRELLDLAQASRHRRADD